MFAKPGGRGTARRRRAGFPRKFRATNGASIAPAPPLHYGDVVPPGVSPRKSLHLVAIVAVLLGFSLVTPRARAATPAFANGVTNGFISTYVIAEASGLVVSRQNPAVIWTHNDGTYDGWLFAIATNGTLLAQHYVPDVYNVNMEDIAIGPGPLPQFQYIYLGDIGDNFLSRSSVRVFRFPEPAVYQYESNAVPTSPIVGAEEITLRYPDGPWDCEGLMVDPLTGDLFLATKLTNSSRIYRATRAQLNSTNDITLTFMNESSTFRSVSAADVSSDGSLITTRRTNRISVWARNAGETVNAALARSPTISQAPVIGEAGGELNGEALGFEPNGTGYFTLSEGYLQPLHYFRRTDTLPAPPRVFIAAGTSWEYWDEGAPPIPDWRTVTNAGWPKASAPLGYGGGERTTVNYGESDQKFPTTYFRRVFASASLIQSNLALRLCFNDGVVVYLNGKEVLRRNLPGDATYETYATAAHTDQRRTWTSYPVPPSFLRTGTNVLAVELHRADADGSWLNFDLQLIEARVEAPARVSSVRRSGTNCLVSITGPTGLVARVEQSLDLVNWSLHRQFPLTNGATTLTNPFTPPRRYFRVAP